VPETFSVVAGFASPSQVLRLFFPKQPAAYVWDCTEACVYEEGRIALLAERSVSTERSVPEMQTTGIGLANNRLSWYVAAGYTEEGPRQRGTATKEVTVLGLS
jgi:hypothetical protein